MEKKQRSIGMARVKVKIDDYNNSMFKNGFFDPICPPDYNFLTGYCLPTITSQRGGLAEYNLARKVNGLPIFKS